MISPPFTFPFEPGGGFKEGTYCMELGVTGKQ